MFFECLRNLFSYLQCHFLEINKKHDVFSEKIKDLEKEKNAHENNLNHLNEVVEENIKKTNYLENLVNTNGKKSEKIAEKAGLNTKKCEEFFFSILFFVKLFTKISLFLVISIDLL